MSDELEKAVDSQLSKYLTAQSGYMAIILMILVPFVKTMLLSDFSTSVPLENIVFTMAFLLILVIANFKDKQQEHNNAVSALSTPKTTEAFLEGFGKIAKGIQATQVDTIKGIVEECLKEHTPRVIEKRVEVPVEVEKIIYVPEKVDTTDVNTTGD